MDNRPTILRTMRAWTGLNQADAALKIGVSKRLLVDAEAGSALSDKTWELAMVFYASQGLHWRDGDAIEPSRMIVVLGARASGAE